MDAETDGHRDGETYDPYRDFARLNRQCANVFDLIRDGHWRTLKAISDITEEPEPSVSARLRDLRKNKYGRWNVERRHVSKGLWEYRINGRQPPEDDDQLGLMI